MENKHIDVVASLGFGQFGPAAAGGVLGAHAACNIPPPLRARATYRTRYSKRQHEKRDKKPKHVIKKKSKKTERNFRKLYIFLIKYIYSHAIFVCIRV